MTREEANSLANHITLWSANEQRNYHEGLRVEVKPLGDGNTYVIVVNGRGKHNWHVWSWQGWKQDFEPSLNLEPEQDEGEVA